MHEYVQLQTSSSAPTLFPPPFPATLSSLQRSHSTPALRLGRELGRAGDLPEGDVRVIGTHKPVEPPVAAGLESPGETIAIGPAADTAVSLAPAIGGIAC